MDVVQPTHARKFHEKAIDIADSYCNYSTLSQSVKSIQTIEFHNIQPKIAGRNINTSKPTALHFDRKTHAQYSNILMAHWAMFNIHL